MKAHRSATVSKTLLTMTASGPPDEAGTAIGKGLSAASESSASGSRLKAGMPAPKMLRTAQ